MIQTHICNDLIYQYPFLSPKKLTDQLDIDYFSFFGNIYIRLCKNRVIIVKTQSWNNVIQNYFLYCSGNQSFGSTGFFSTGFSASFFSI